MAVLVIWATWSTIKEFQVIKSQYHKDTEKEQLGPEFHHAEMSEEDITVQEELHV